MITLKVIDVKVTFSVVITAEYVSGSRVKIRTAACCRPCHI